MAILISLLCHAVLIVVFIKPENNQKKLNFVEIRFSLLRRAIDDVAIQSKDLEHQTAFAATKSSLTQKLSRSPRASTETVTGRRYARDDKAKNFDVVTLPPPPKYPELAQSMGIDGDVKLRISTNASGQIQDMIVISQLGYGLDECALEWSKQFPFPPNTITEATVRFVLD